MHLSVKPYARRSFAVCSCFVAASVAFSSTYQGLFSLKTDIAQLIELRQRLPRGEFSNDPTEPFRGTTPASRAGGDSAAPSDAFVPPVITAVAAAPGGSFSWEGSSPAAAGTVNTANGNKLTELRLLSWKVRGGDTLELTLYHNSEGSGSGELGYLWTTNWDVYVSTSSGSPVVHWGDGTAVAYTGAGPSYTPRAGFYDALVKNADNTWTLTKKTGTRYTLGTSGYLTKIQDLNGNAITVARNSSNVATSVSDPTGRSLTFALDGTGTKLQSATDPLGRSWSFTLNANSDLAKVTWPSLGDGNTYTDAFAYDTTSHAILTHTDRRSKNWSATYNSGGSVASETDPLGHATTYAYTSGGTTITDPLSHARTDNYSSGALTSRQDESGFSVSYSARDANFNPTTVVDKNGKTWVYTYDSKGNVLTAKDPLLHTSTYTYNGFAEVLTKQDALSHTTTLAYDTYGNLLTVTNALAKVVLTNTYDSYGQLQSAKNALIKTSTFAYDSNGNLHTVTDSLSNVTTFAYDAAGRLTGVTDPLTHLEQQAYDAWGRETTTTHSDTSTVVKAHDAAGNLLSVTDENAHATTYAHDDAGRLTSKTNPNLETETYGYDNANRRTTVTNGRGKVRTYTFTNRGDVSSLTMPDGAYEQWTHDGNGNTTAYVNPLGQTLNYPFDDAGRATGTTYPSGTNTTVAYDNADRRTSMTDATGTTTWGYDNADRVTSLATPQGTLSYTLDDEGRRTAMASTGGPTTALNRTFGYDDDNRLTSETNEFAETTSFQYDAAGRLSKQTFANGCYTVPGYDSRNRETSSVHYKAGGTTISSESYALDYAGNLSSKTVNGTTTTYGYDAADQLTSESKTGYVLGYSYDANGNRLTRTLNGSTDSYAYDDGDKLTSVTNGGAAVKSFTYDAAGREKTVTTSSGTTTLSYDYEDRLVSISFPSGSSSTFSYNGLDARTGKTNAYGPKSYLRDGAGVTAPVLWDGSTNLTPDASWHNASGSTFLGQDRLGSTKMGTDSTGSTTLTRDYDAFGNFIGVTGASYLPWGFAGSSGYWEESESSLLQVGHRYYDPSTGRFLTRDHAKDGRNWYAYCANNPVRNVDPTGQFIWLIIGAVAVVTLLIIIIKHRGGSGGGLGRSSGPSPVAAPAAPEDGENWTGHAGEFPKPGGKDGFYTGLAKDGLVDGISGGAEMEGSGNVSGVGGTLLEGESALGKGIIAVGGYSKRLKDISNGIDEALGDPDYNPWKRRP